MPSVSAENEWSPLKSIIIGRAAGSCFPSEPARMMASTMQEQYMAEFRPDNPFPQHILDHADSELDQLTSILENEGVKVYRPKNIDWRKVGGYTGSMPRDGLLSVGNHIIEAPFSWGCRRDEIEMAYGNILQELARDTSVRVMRAPSPPQPDTLYDGPTDGPWTINDSRPAFDAADFMRFGKTLLGQFSHVTNAKGVDYLQAQLPAGYNVEMLDITDPHAMHIDTVILPLRRGLLVYNPARTTKEALRKHEVLKDWELLPVPFTPPRRLDPPSYTCSDWLVMNVLVLDGHKVIVDVTDVEFANWMRELGMEPILCPLRHVNSIGGAAHCASVDLVREEE